MKNHARLIWYSFAALLVMSTPGAAPAAPTAPQPAFDFFELQIQKTDKRGDAHHSKYKSGELFYVSWYVRIVKPPAHDDELIFLYSVTPVGEEAGKRLRSTAKVPAGYGDGVFRCGDAALKLTQNRKKILKIKAQVMMNGVTRTRTTTITIVP